MKTEVKYGIILLVVAAILVAYAVATNITGDQSSTRIEEVPPMERGRVIDYGDGNIKHHHGRHHIRQVDRMQLSSRSLLATGMTGPCYIATQDEFGDSGTFAKVVRGSLHVHYCVGRLHPNRIVKVWPTFDHWEWWLQRWSLDWQRKASESPVLWTTTWCSSSGYGPCYPVQRKTYKWSFQFVRRVPVTGWMQHATFGAVCTVRGQAPGRSKNYECYSGKWSA